LTCKKLPTNGLPFKKATTANRELYNGKEQQTDFDLGYFDYGFRQLDPQLCVWHTPDLLAETDYSTSAYAYCAGDPINKTDLYGLLPQASIAWNDYAPAYFELQEGGGLMGSGGGG